MIAQSKGTQMPPRGNSETDVQSASLSIWQGAILPYLGTRLALVLVGLLADFYILPLLKPTSPLPSVGANTHFPNLLWLMWQRFDSGFYLNIARGGYSAVNQIHIYSNWAFFPLYPLLISPFGHLFGGSETAFSLAGLLVSNSAALLAIIYFYLLVKREFGEKVASCSIMYLALFPTSFYLSAIYTESTFLCCAVACIYYARSHRWWLAGLCGGLASLARAQGILLLLPLAWEYWQMISDRYIPLVEAKLDATQKRGLPERSRAWLESRLRGSRLAVQELQTWLSLAALALVPAGLLSFMLYGQTRTGDLFTTFHIQAWGWGRHWENPLQLLWHTVTSPEAANPMDWNFWILNIILVGIFLGFTVWAFKKLPMTYALYTLAMVLLPLSSSRLNSISRYFLVVFPVYILLALWSTGAKQNHRSYFLMTLFCMVQAVFMIFFVLGFPSIA